MGNKQPVRSELNADGEQSKARRFDAQVASSSAKHVALGTARVSPTQDRHNVAPLKIPRFGQHFDPEDWEKDGFDGPEHSKQWSDCACGLACIRMILGYLNMPVPDPVEMLWRGVELGAYSSRGWIHQGLVELARSYSLDGDTISVPDLNPLEEAVNSGIPSIVSVTHKFPTDGHKGGHLVVFAGLSSSDQANVAPQRVVHVRDPSRWGEINRCIPVSRFLHSFTGRSILLWAAQSEA